MKHRHVYSAVVSYYNDELYTPKCTLGAPKCVWCGKHSKLCGCHRRRPKKEDTLIEIQKIFDLTPEDFT